MGTRNLTMVIMGGKTRVAQYGQWDGYPKGQGATILNFLKSTDLNHFSGQLKKVRFITEEDKKKREEFLKSIGSTDGWINMEQSAKYDNEFPYDSRDIGGQILKMIDISTDDEIVLIDSTNFAQDSLFCEWAYVVDLDKRKLEVYKGFVKVPPENPDSRFGNELPEGEEYYPVQIAGEFDIDNLPEEEEFFDYFKKLEDEEDDDDLSDPNS